MKQLKVYDDFLNPEDYENLRKLMMDDSLLNWNFSDGINMPGDGKYQFCHIFYHRYQPRSEYWGGLIPMIERIDPSAIVRIKANLNMRTPEIEEYELHTDVDDAITSIYYVNTNNGYTRFEDGTKVDSIANRMLVFDSNMKHAGSSCTDELRRCVINFNYYV
jgi:hypothetical protein